METVFRLLVAGFVVLAPSALFVLLIRVLDRMRDDQLVDRVLDHLDDQRSPSGGPTAVLTGGLVDGSPAPDEALVPCPGCGAPNPRFARFCGNCMGHLRAPDRR